MNHNRFDRKNNRGRMSLRAIDGVSRTPSRRWEGSINLRRPSSYQPGIQQSETVGNFDQNEGFHPASQDLIKFDQKTDTPKPKIKAKSLKFWRLFSRNKNKKPKKQLTKKQLIFK